ncbi:MAG: Gfo/Idh/MocA family oxidoreductase [Planctomycetota bacterium]
MTAQIAFLSTAHIHTESFIEAFSGDGLDAEVAAIWDDTPPRGRKYAESCGARFVDDLNALVADDAIDGWVICDANTRHLPLLEKALPTGKPVFCEKPLVTSVADARRVAALLREHGTALCCGYFQPFFAANRAVKRAIDDGAFGQVTHAFFRNSHHAAYGRWFDSADLGWFVRPELSGGGALMDMGAHAVHLLCHLCGPVRDVWATTANVSGAYPAVDDYGTMQLTFASGAVGRAEASWVQHSSNSGLEIWGTDAALVFVEGRPAVVSQGGKPRRLPDAEARPDRMARLVAMIEGRLDPQEMADDLAACLDEVAIMSAAYASAASDRREVVDVL